MLMGCLTPCGQSSDSCHQVSDSIMLDRVRGLPSRLQLGLEVSAGH